jgi:hypothetical protein
VNWRVRHIQRTCTLFLSLGFLTWTYLIIHSHRLYTLLPMWQLGRGKKLKLALLR